MKVHFIASLLNVESREDSLRKIEATIEAQGCTLVRKWIDDQLNKPLAPHDAVVWASIYKETMDAVVRADVIIAEITQKAFFVGFQVALALNLKKPVLLLSQEDLRSFRGMDEAEDIVRFAIYNDNNIEQHISKFIEEYKDGAKSVRFNFFIDRKGLNYLNMTALNSGETKAEVLRRLLDEDMKKD